MRKFVWACLLLALCTAVALAQRTTGSIYGTVTTEEGLVIQGVTVTLTSGHSAARTTTSSERGTFYFGEVPIGEFTITCEKEGYQKVVTENINVYVMTASRIEIAMEPSPTEAVITITGETAVVDLKRTGTSAAMTQDVLANIPSARDPWVILDQVVSIQTDRVNIGGAESGQQSNFVSHGSGRGQSSWNVDGVTITDQAALGASPMYFDFDAFEEMQLTTGGADASVQIGGTNLNFITKQGSDTFHGQGSVYYTDDSFQGKNVPSEMEAVGYKGNQISSIKDYGFDVGGPIWKGNIWFWGAYRVQDIILLAVTGQEDATKLENYNLKLTGQAGDRTRLTFFYTRGDKIKSGRGASERRPPETTWDQSGPTPVYKLEGTYMATEDLILSGKLSYVGGGFQLEPKGGRNVPVTYEYSTATWGGSYYWYETTRPQYQVQITGENYVDEAFGGSHEFKAGFEWRKTPVTSLSNYGNGIVKGYYYGASDDVWFVADAVWSTVNYRTSFYLMDIFARDRFTFNVGLRYDRQWGNNTAGTSRGQALDPYGYLPDLTYPDIDKEFTWNDVVPRLGFTYDIAGDGKFIARANFSMYADQLGSGDVAQTTLMGWREIDYLWDDDGDDTVETNELAGPIYWSFDYTDPLKKSHFVTSDLSAPMTTEFIGGLEKEIMPEISLAANFVYRRLSNYNWVTRDGVSSSDYYVAGTVKQGGYSRPYYDTDKSRPLTDTFRGRPDYHRTYKGFEVQLSKRLSNRWMANLGVNIQKTTQHYESPASYTDPTNIDFYNDRVYAPLTSGSGKSDIWVGSGWAIKGSALYQFRWDINVSGFMQYRQGTIRPLTLLGPRNNWGSYIYPLAIPFGDEHLPSLFVMDFRLEKAFSITDIGRVDLIVDIFNLFNSATPLKIEHRVYSSNYNNKTEILNPRVFRMGVRFRF